MCSAAFSGGPFIHSSIFFSPAKDGQLNSYHILFYFILFSEAKSALNNLRHLGVIQAYLSFIRRFKKQTGFKETGKENLEKSI